MRILLSPTLVTLALISGCGTPSSPGPLPQANFAVITTSGGVGAGGALNTVSLSDHTVVAGIDTNLDQDTAVRVFDGKAYVLNRTPGSLAIFDITTWAAPVEIPTGDANAPHNTSNPNDVFVLPGGHKAYVSLFGNDGAHAVGVIDLDGSAPPGVSRFVSIPVATSDPDGKPEATVFHYCDGKLYCALQDIDESTYLPSGPGRLAVIDSATDTLSGTIPLVGQNPYTLAAEGADCHTILVADSGPYGKEPDHTAGIERVDLAAAKSLGMVLWDSDIAGRPETVSVANPHLAFSAIYYDLEPQSMGPPVLSSTKVIAFDPSAAKVLGDVTGKAPFIAFAELAPSGEIYVGVDAYPGSLEQGKLGSGLYVGKADGSMIATTPIDLQQNPYAIAFPR